MTMWQGAPWSEIPSTSPKYLCSLVKFILGSSSLFFPISWLYLLLRSIKNSFCSEAINELKPRGRGGGDLVDRAADSGPYDPSSIPLGEKKENKRKRGWGWPIFIKMNWSLALALRSELHLHAKQRLDSGLIAKGISRSLTLNVQLVPGTFFRTLWPMRQAWPTGSTLKMARWVAVT